VPRFYFHLSNSDVCIRDDIGCDVLDLAAAHFRAKNLARRVTTFSGLGSHETDWRRWTVTVKDDCQGPVLTVMFAPWLAFEESSVEMQMNGVRALQKRLALTWGETD
jgi:hypothetical protein